MRDNPVFLTEKVEYYRSVLATPHANRAHLGPPNGGPGAVGAITCLKRKCGAKAKGDSTTTWIKFGTHKFLEGSL